MINEDMSMGETVSAILTNVETGKKRVIDGKINDAPEPKPEVRYKIEVKVTDIRTGEVHKYETTR